MFVIKIHSNFTSKADGDWKTIFSVSDVSIERRDGRDVLVYKKLSSDQVGSILHGLSGLRNIGLGELKRLLGESPEQLEGLSKLLNLDPVDDEHELADSDEVYIECLAGITRHVRKAKSRQ